MPSDELLTVEEVAKWLKVNPQTVRNWLDRGELRGLRVGARRVRIRQEDLDSFIAAGETRPGASGELGAAMAGITRAESTSETVTALRVLAAAAERVAVALEAAECPPPGAAERTESH